MVGTASLKEISQAHIDGSYEISACYRVSTIIVTKLYGGMAPPFLSLEWVELNFGYVGDFE
jgi:hypothetical protein